MTRTYREYLKIARLIAKRARLIRMVSMYPNSQEYNERLSDVCKELMYHQTANDSGLTEEDIHDAIDIFFGGDYNV
jgi:hypothetical protein